MKASKWSMTKDYFALATYIITGLSILVGLASLVVTVLRQEWSALGYPVLLFGLVHFLLMGLYIVVLVATAFVRGLVAKGVSFRRSFKELLRGITNKTFYVPVVISSLCVFFLIAVE